MVSLLYFVSGASGLVYEVLWARYLSLLFGGTALAHTIVLCTFMAGLALGNALLAPPADRSKDPLRLYGHLELGVALSGILAPVLLKILGRADLVALKVGGSAVVLLLPTMLMGGTLGGNATLIGSTANIVAAGVVERREMGKITFGEWLKPGLIVAIITMLLVTVLLVAQLSLMPHTTPAAMGR